MQKVLDLRAIYLSDLVLTRVHLLCQMVLCPSINIFPNYIFSVDDENHKFLSDIKSLVNLDLNDEK